MLQFKKELLYILFISLTAGCSRNSDATAEYHPIKERIPYWNSDVQTQNVRKEAKDLTTNIISRQDLTFSPLIAETFNISTLTSANLPLTSVENILFRSINMDRLAIFDVFKQRLYEYHMSADSWDIVAESGSGPGELSNVQDIVIENDTVTFTEVKL